jgi:hypothetical protein
VKKRSFIRIISDDPFDIPADRILFESIIEDMNKNSGQFRPAPVWDVERDGHNDEYLLSRSQQQELGTQGLSEENFQRNYSNMKQMLDPWIGCTGLQSISPGFVSLYLAFIKEIDFLNIVPTYFNLDGSLKVEAQKLIIADLGSMIDVNLIDTYASPTKPMKVIEVGGGYGRLAEALINIYDYKIKYCLVDVVPASILYSYQYLKKTFPNLRIGFYYNNDAFDFERFDCFIIPAWHFERINNITYDIAVNIQSMQEMEQHHVDYYLTLFDEIIKINGLIYLANEKDYIFQGKWNFPKNWEILLKHQSPRYFTRRSPLEMFRKTKSSARAKNIAYLLRYFESLTLVDHLNRINALSHLIPKVDELSHLIPKVNELSHLISKVDELSLLIPKVDELSHLISQVNDSLHTFEDGQRNKGNELEARMIQLELSLSQLKMSQQNLHHLERLLVPIISFLKKIRSYFKK